MIDVGGLEDFEERTCRIVEVDEREIGIVRWQDRFYAIHNRCPHMGGPVCLGSLGPRVDARDGVPGVLEADENRPMLACAWHRWEFDVASGRSHWDPGFRLKTYPVSVENGRVMVDVKGRSTRKKRTPGGG